MSLGIPLLQRLLAPVPELEEVTALFIFSWKAEIFPAGFPSAATTMQQGLTPGIHVEAPHLQIFLGEFDGSDQERSQLRERHDGGQVDGGAGIKVGRV